MESADNLGASLTEQGLAVAQAFVQARRDARVLESYPGERPSDLSLAYRIQDRAIVLDGRGVIGWKVGKINPPDDARLGCNRLAGPIFADTVLPAGPGVIPDMPIFAGGFAAAEAELLLHLAPGWDGTFPNGDTATRLLLDDVRIGIEIASSPYPGINADGPTVTASDFGNNAGLVIGPQLASWQDLDLCTILVRTEIDDEVVGESTAATMLDGPYGAVRFLLANLTERGFDLSDGLWVSTGAITGVHSVKPGQRVTATFGKHGALACTIARARPR